MEDNSIDFESINGWGVDADPKNDPTYPMKKRTDAEHKGYSWKRPTLQESDVEVHHSNERPNVTAVYGTSVPPSGLSGVIRRHAFNYSESSYRHWLSLMLADRVNMVEGIVDDLRHGHVPNLFSERGLRADWHYDRRRLVTKCAVGLALTAGVAILLSQRGKSRRASPSRRRMLSRKDREEQQAEALASAAMHRPPALPPEIQEPAP